MLGIIILGVFGGLLLFRVFPYLIRGVLLLIGLHFLFGWPM